MYKDINGQDVKWKPKSSPRKNASKNHSRAVKLIYDMMPTVRLFEECVLPIGNRKKLYLDIYLPDYNLAIEVDGKQHQAYSAFFHGSIENFLKQKSNDRQKEEWCDINNITLIRLEEQESNDEWREQISLSC